MAVGDPVQSGLQDPNNPLAFSFFSNSPLSGTEIERRKAIAAALASQKRPFPKNIGEGLTSLGEAVGDRFNMNRLAAQEAQYAKDKAVAPELRPFGATVPGATPPTPAPASVPASPSVPATPLTPAVPAVPSPTAGFAHPADALKDRLANLFVGGGQGGPGGATPNPTAAAEPPPQTIDTQAQPRSVASFPEATASGDGDILAARRSAIGGIESGGRKDPYRTIGNPTKYGRALGRYGVVEDNVGPWTQAALGEALTPAQFLANDKAQDAVFDHRFGSYVARFGEENAARAWFGGPGNINRPNLTDLHERLSIKDYGKDYLRRLTAAGGSPASARAPQPNPASGASLAAGVASASQGGAGQSLDDTGPPNIESDPGGGAGETGGDNPPTPTTIKPRSSYTDISPPPPVKFGSGPGTDPRFAISPDIGPYPVKDNRPGPEELRGMLLLNHPRFNDQATKDFAKDLIARGAAEREADYQRRVDDWKLRYQTKEKEALDQAKFAREVQPKMAIEQRKAEFEQTQAEEKAKLEKRLGGQTVQQFIADFKPVYQDAQKSVTALNNIKEAESAIRAGAITGYGANARLDAQRMSAWVLSNGQSDNVAAETQRLKTNLDSMIGQALAKLQPGDNRVTEGDRVMASGLSGSIDQQRQAILKILAVAKQDAHETINDFEELRHKRVGGHELEDSFKLKMRPNAPDPAVQHLLNDPNANNRAHFDKTFGPGSAQLEIDRARRRDEAAARK